MKKDRIIDKIQKCLRLSESANANEAASALRQAHRLMRKFNINELEVVDVVKESSARSGGYYNPPFWAVALSDLVAQSFECRAYVQRRDENWPLFKFIGMNHSAEIAAYTFTYLFRALRNARRAFMKENDIEDKDEHRRRGHVFAQAWLFRIARTVSEFTLNETNNEKIEEYVSAYYSEAQEAIKHPTDPEQADYDTILSGMRAAHDVSLFRPVVCLTETNARIGVCA